MCLLQNKLEEQYLIDKNSSSQDLYFVYVLKLKNNKYYVGKTKNLQKRLESHRQGTTVFTRKYNSVQLIECIRTNMKYMENNLYFKYVEKYGIDNVRGDIFSRETLPPIDIYYIKKIYKNEDNPENIDSIELIKKGVHLHFPDINVNKNMALEIRKACIPRLSSFKDKFENSISDILDESVFIKSGLRLTGSRKGHFISQTKEFIDEGRPYNLLFILKENLINEEMYNDYKYDIESLINRTSIITLDTFITNIKNNPNLNCDECDDEYDDDNFDNNNDGNNWKRLNKSDIKYIEIENFFQIYVKQYTKKDIKRIFCSDNENVYILCSVSKFCTNIGKNHNSEHIYFKLTKDGICQKCFCKCDTLNGRQYGFCKDYSSPLIPCSPLLKKKLGFKDSKNDNNINIKKNDENLNVATLFDNLRDEWYNKFTNKQKLVSKKPTSKKKL